jgi:hypothetical protein
MTRSDAGASFSRGFEEPVNSLETGQLLGLLQIDAAVHLHELQPLQSGGPPDFAKRHRDSAAQPQVFDVPAEATPIEDELRAVGSLQRPGRAAGSSLTPHSRPNDSTLSSASHDNRVTSSSSSPGA